MMMKVKIITNNALVREAYQVKADITYTDCNYLEVLTAARDMIHQGFKLLNHPLAGSVKPNETPFRTLLLEFGQELDLLSLEIIENSIMTYLKFSANRNTPLWDEKILGDFRFVDLSLFKSALQSLKQKIDFLDDEEEQIC